MSRTDRIKEAIKVALAFVVAYWIALRFDWMNPYWAGFAITFVSLGTTGASLNKAALRMGGTLLGCVAALIFMGMFPQQRFAFITVVSVYLAVVTYISALSLAPLRWVVGP